MKITLSILYLMTAMHHISMVESKIPLHLGVYLPFDSGSYFDIGNSVLVSIEIATEIINNRTDILQDYELKLHVSNTKAQAPEAIKQLFNQIHTPPTKIMILGPIFSKVSISLAEAATAWNLLQFVFVPRTPALSDRKRFPHFYRTLPDEISSNPLRLSLLNHFRWKKIAILFEDETANTFSAAMEELREKANTQNITTVVFKGLKNEEGLVGALDLIQKQDARIIFISSYLNMARQTLCQAYKRGLYGKKFVWVLVGWTLQKRPWWLDTPPAGTPCTPQELEIVQKGHFTTNYLGLRNKPNSSDINILGMTSDDFISEHLRRIPFDLSSSSYIGFAFDALVSAALTLNRSIEILESQGKRLEVFSYNSSDMSAIFNEILDDLVFAGMTGPVSYRNGARVGISTLEQSQDSTYETAAMFDPYEEQLQMDPSTPIKWIENHIPVDGTQKVKYKMALSSGVVISMVSLASIGILVSLFFLYFNIKNRNLKYIKLSSPNLNNLVAVGGIISYSYIILAGMAGTVVLSENMNILCTAKVWILCFGFSVTFGAIFSKTWRVHLIMSTKTAKKKILKDGHLFIIIIMVLAVDVGILMTWAIVDPWKVTSTFLSEKVDPYNDDIVYECYLLKCQSQYKVYWTSAIYIYKGVFVLFGVFLAWDTRHVRIAALNDSKFIGLSIYNVTVLCVIGAPIGYVIDDEDFENAYIINSLFIIFSASITLCLVFVPKMIALHLNPGGEANINTVSVAPAATAGTSNSQAGCSGIITTRLQQVVKQQEEKIAHLQKELQQFAQNPDD